MLRLLPLALLFAAPALAQPLKVATDKVEAPYSLTASDGTGLELVGLDARAVVDGPLAFTELRLTFKNPQPRTIEGHFKVTMPDDAAISRFAMKIRGQWMEGEVVEKQAARRAYEDALHRRQDPALLEQDSGNSFRARVFPIPANGQKELIISWSHELTKAGEAYRLPLKGLPSIAQLDLTAMTAASKGAGPKSSLGGETSRYQVSKVSKTNFAPDQDWVVFGGAAPAGGDALRADNLAVARFTVQGDNAPEDLAHAVLMFDTSASRAIDFEGRLSSLRALVNGLASIGISRVQVIAFDQFTESVFDGAPKSFGDDALAALRRRGPLGASSLETAVAALENTEGAGRRVIVLTDGMVTAGEADMEKLRARISALGARGIQRVDTLVDTTARDADVLRMLVTTDLPRPGKVVEGRAALAKQLDRLGKRTLGDIQVAIPGAKWTWPTTLKGTQPGDQVVAFAELAAGAPLSVQLTGGHTATINPAVRDGEKPLLERAWVSARIKRLEHMRTQGDADLKGALKHQIIALSTRHRVLSPYTALVVLETENDYRRFNIDRRALANILTVGPTGVDVISRAGKQQAIAAVRRPPPAPPRDARRTARNKDTESFGEGRAGGGAPAGGAPPAAEPALADATGAAEMEESKSDDVAAAPRRERAPQAAPRPMAKKAKRRSRGPRTSAAPVATRTAVAADDDADGDSFGGAERARRVATGRSAGRADPFPAERRPPPPPRTRPLQVAKPTGETRGRKELRKIEKMGKASLTGKMAAIDKDLRAGRAKKALKAAMAWRAEAPTDLLALVALGRAHAQSGNGLDAARAFGSVLDLYPSRADMRRFAGNWLERLGAEGLALAADTYNVAREQRPDHPSIYHQLAMVEMRQGAYAQAMDTVLNGLNARRVGNRFRGVERILQEDAQLIGAAWAKADPSQREAITKRLAAVNLKIDDAESLRFVLTWETDANDVDFHIFDKKFNHAFYSRKALASGGELYADITTGYGPECFTIYAPKAAPYLLKAHYYRKGPMGHGAGKLQVIRHDGKGGFGFEERPFVIMTDGAYVDLGKVTEKTAPIAKSAARPRLQIAK